MDEAKSTCDLLIVGGGINGAGIARDAVGRGLSVVLCEQDDLAAATSSRSSKLVHGGLRYLEYYEFRLVREALIEREVLLGLAPHIIWPLRFVLPHSREQRPAWLVRLGLFLYDHLGGRRRLPGCQSVNLRRSALGDPVQDEFVRAFAYSDCWVDDARLVVLNALDAAERGARILTRTALLAARREGQVWRATLANQRDGSHREIHARCIVNAAGPWVDTVLRERLGIDSGKRVRLVRGSHLVVPRLYQGDQAYLLQNDDRRVVFVIPYEGDYTLIGTTDIPQDEGPEQVAMTEAEAEYLCRASNRYCKRQIAPADAVWRYAGVRPLYDDAADDPSAVTRDYVFDVDGTEGQAPVLSIFGGKITTYRKLAEQALARLRRFFPALRPPWTATAPLPGGDMPGADFARFRANLRAAHPWLGAALGDRYARLYGTRSAKLLEGARQLEDLGRHFGAGLYEREVEYLRAQEWAETAADILWRRTKLGLHLTQAESQAFQHWLENA